MPFGNFTYSDNSSIWKISNFLLSHISLCVSSGCPCTECVSTSCKTLRRCQHLSALNSINQINDDNNLSAVQSPRRTSQVIYRYCVIQEHGTRCSSPQDVSVDVSLRPTDGDGSLAIHPPAICPAAMHTSYITHTDGLICLIN